MKIDFVIVGVQKGGTTALDKFLREHPRIQMANVKEVHYFDNEAVNWKNPDYKLYHKHFSWSDSTVIRGEATPIYIYWPNSLERLHDYRPDIKIILGLRHPALRAYSHWKMEVGRGNETMSFLECITEMGRSRVANSPNKAHRVHSYIERGLYRDQLPRLLSVFRRDQILFYRTDDLWRQKDRLVASIHSFLGVEPRPVVGKGYIVPVQPTKLELMSHDIRDHLNTMYRTDIVTAATLTGLDLSEWLLTTYQEPMSAEL